VPQAKKVVVAKISFRGKGCPQPERSCPAGWGKEAASAAATAQSATEAVLLLAPLVTSGGGQASPRAQLLLHSLRQGVKPAFVDQTLHSLAHRTQQPRMAAEVESQSGGLRARLQ